MAQQQLTTVIRSCDVCDKSVTLVQGNITPADLAAAAGWYLVNKEHLLNDTQLAPIAGLACSAPCALELINGDKLELPSVPEPKDNVLDFAKVN